MLGLKLLPGLLLALSVSAPVLAQNAQDAPAPNNDKAAEILKQARAAVGDEGKLKALQSLSFSGASRRMFNERELTSEIQFEFLLPDKVKRTSSFTPPFGNDVATTVTTTEVINGDQVWFESSAPAGGPGRFGPGGQGGPGGEGGPGGQGRQGGGPGGFNGEMRQNLTRNEFLRLLLGILVTAPTSIKAEYSYAGEAKAPDGTADVVEVKGPGNQLSRIFVDQKSHHVIMISFKGRNQMLRGGRGGAAAPGQPGQRPELTPEEREKRRREIAEQMARAPEVDIFMRFAEYKNVNGLSLPHLITRSTGSTPNEELAIEKYKINPKLNPDRFIQKDKDQKDKEKK